MLSPANGEQIHLVNYVEDYLDSIESLPFDLQRNVSLMREIDAKYQGTAGWMGGGGRSIPAGRGRRGAAGRPAPRPGEPRARGGALAGQEQKVWGVFDSPRSLCAKPGHGGGRRNERSQCQAARAKRSL